MTNESTSLITKVFEYFRPTPDRSMEAALLEQIQQRDDSLELMLERVAELEREDAGWQRVLSGGDGREPDRETRNRIRELARLLAMKHPLIKRGLAVQSHYVWAQGVSIQAHHDEINTVVQAFLDDAKNQVELTSPIARMQKDKELATDGNLFLVFFPHPVTGRVRMRTIPDIEIVDVICNPDDAKEPWYYKRVWTTKGVDAKAAPTQHVAYYPDWRYLPSGSDRLRTLNDHPVKWSAPVYHIKTGGFSDWKFGFSEIYAGIDWARAYKDFLEDWATITRAYSKFAFQLTTNGGKKGVAAAKTRLGTTLANGGTMHGETNPPPTVASTLVAAEGNKIDPVKTAGATTKMEDGRRLLLMVAAAMNLPETFFGDVSVGTLATAESMDRPTELAMLARQLMWSGVFESIIQYVLLWAVKASAGPLRALGTVNADREDNSETLVWKPDVDAHIDIDFPKIVQAVTKDQVVAIVAASAKIPNGQVIAKMLLTALGQDDIDELLEPYYDKDGTLKPEYQPVQPTTNDQRPTTKKPTPNA